MSRRTAFALGAIAGTFARNGGEWLGWAIHEWNLRHLR